MKLKNLIKGYAPGANISLLNTIYIRQERDPNTGKYSSDYIYIIFRDMNTGEKKVQLIENPKYTYYLLKPEYHLDYNKEYIEEDKVFPVECEYRNLLRSIADKTGKKELFMQNIRNGNSKANSQLLLQPNVFFAGINIEDYYRFWFDQLYKNDTYIPTKVYFDIEVDTIDMKGNFPEPGECPINAITMLDDINHIAYTLLLNDHNNPQIDEFHNNINNEIEELKQFVIDKVGGPEKASEFHLDDYKYKIAFFENEIDLIVTLFNLINYLKPDFALAWNISFDITYLIARLRRLGINPEQVICGDDNTFPIKRCEYFVDNRPNKFEQKGDYALITCWTVYLDQLISFASKRKGQRSLGSFKLDSVGEAVAGVRKLDYSNITRDITKLVRMNYKIFVFYNIMDTIVQLCVEVRSGDIDFILSKSLTNNTRYSKVHRQTVYLTNRAIKDYLSEGYIVGCNPNSNNPKEGFEGAFSADPLLFSDKYKVKLNGNPIDLVKNCDDFDYKSLYPSTEAQSNMSRDTMIGKIILPEQIDKRENRYNTETFNRSVWFVEDLTSENPIDFCERYLQMPGYERMHDLIMEYFATVKNPYRALKFRNNSTGKRIMCHKIDNTQKRVMCRIIEDKTRTMVIRQERTPNYDFDSNE